MKVHLSNIDKAAIAGLAVGGVGVAIAAGLAEINSVRPKPELVRMQHGFSEVSFQIPVMPVSKEQLCHTVVDAYVNNKDICKKIFRSVGQMIIGPLVFVALDGMYANYASANNGTPSTSIAW